MTVCIFYLGGMQSVWLWWKSVCSAAIRTQGESSEEWGDAEGSCATVMFLHSHLPWLSRGVFPTLSAITPLIWGHCKCSPFKGFSGKLGLPLRHRGRDAEPWGAGTTRGRRAEWRAMGNQQTSTVLGMGNLKHAWD